MECFEDVMVRGRKIYCGVALGIAVREVLEVEAAARASGRRALDIEAMFRYAI